MQVDFIRSPLNRWTFKHAPMREWVEHVCEGGTLNLFAGRTPLAVDEVRNDIEKTAFADFHKDALDFLREWNGDLFSTILLDPPYSYRKSMEMYKGHKASRFKLVKDAIPRVLRPGGLVITFGYHSIVMGRSRGFTVERIGLFSHGGAIHDTIASVERRECA